VVISLKDGEATHRVQAWEILYNRTRNILTASGKVVYVKTEGDTVETFRGESITVNLDNWSSLFMDGLSERSIADSDTTYRFSGAVISRSDEDVTVLTKAQITNGKNDEALWSLNASKLWLLPGSDWAIFNAVLKVGHIPVLYLPFLYYPTDEIIFHPVLGTRSREGSFIQTTTYILGRPSTTGTAEISISKILGSSVDMEKTREGLFLRSTGKTNRDPNETRLSVILDGYTNLGAYLGSELALPRKGILGATDVSLGFGFTRNVYNITTNHNTPFFNYEGSSDWNSSRLISFTVPFRYRLNAKGSLSAQYGSFAWTFPYYSDPYVNRDFLKRSEELDWFNMLRQGSAGTDEETTEDLLGSYEWRLSGSLNPPISKLSPYLSSLSISNISSTVSFRTRGISTTHPSYTTKTPADPARTFFYPDKITLFSINASLGGTPLTLGGTTSAAPAAEQEGKEESPSGNGFPAPPISPWGKGDDKKETEKTTDPYALFPPVLSQRFDTARAGSPRFTIDYRLTPSAASEMQFRSSQQNWGDMASVDWNEISSILTTIRSDTSLGFNLAHSEGNAYTLGFRLNGSGSWQDYTYLNENAEEYTSTAGGVTAPDSAKIKAARDRAKSATSFSSTWESSLSVKPFFRNPIWGNTGFQYTLKGLLAKASYNTTLTNPAYEWKFSKWDKENIDTHQISANAVASIMDMAQTFSLTADLPPKDMTLGGDSTIRVWITETNARGKVLEPFEDDERKWDPFYFTETIKIGKLGNFQQYVVYDPELRAYTTLSSTLTLGGFSTSLSAVRSRDYTLESTGWVQSQNTEGLHLRDFRMAYSKTFTKDKLWKNRLAFSVNLNTSLSFDLQRYTNSRFTFSLGFNTKISNFLDFTVSTTSENAVIYRYVQDLPFWDLPLKLPGEKNPFIDLINSFRFDSRSKRTSSGFKLKSFNLSLTHHLGDWNATLGMTLSPYLDSQPGKIPVYKFNNQISFMVQWIPISEVKAEINYDKEKLTLK
jgi:hypothetical protein